MHYSTMPMHKYVIGWIVLFVAFVGSFPIAMHRVGKTEKFAGQAVHSLACNGQTPSKHAVVQFSTCAHLDTATK